MSETPQPTIEEIEETIPDERKNLSFGDADESLIDVLEEADKEAHERGQHEDGMYRECPLCNN
jgi:hypothetical protein